MKLIINMTSIGSVHIKLNNEMILKIYHKMFGRNSRV